ncbi:hypothetical protein BDZ97DRAFT_2062842 [Flammula alnicola]|nr:hypothetical protein BDZ97DRAFT_2062842 [Flammula alnicola]
MYCSLLLEKEKAWLFVTFKFKAVQLAAHGLIHLECGHRSLYICSGALNDLNAAGWSRFENTHESTGSRRQLVIVFQRCSFPVQLARVNLPFLARGASPSVGLALRGQQRHTQPVRLISGCNRVEPMNQRRYPMKDRCVMTGDQPENELNEGEDLA